MTPAIQNLFNRLTDGLAIVGPDGTVRFCNEAMQALLPVALQKPFPLAPVAALLEQAGSGHLSIPHRFETELAFDSQLADPDLLVGHIVRSPVGTDLVVILHDITESRIYSATVSNLTALIEHNLLTPLDRFNEDLAALTETLPAAVKPALAAQSDEVLTRGRALLTQLRNLSAFVTLARGNRLEASERIEIDPWLSSLLGEHMAAARQRRIRLTLSTTGKVLPPLYGSQHWLSEALSACIDNAIRHSDSSSEIMVSATAFAQFVRIDLRNHGRQLRSPMLRARLERPLMRGKAAAQNTTGLGLGLPLARSIIEAHKGRLALEQDLDGFVTCSVELPAASSPHMEQDAGDAQTLRYARDLARLMSMRNSTRAAQADSVATSKSRG